MTQNPSKLISRLLALRTAEENEREEMITEQRERRRALEITEKKERENENNQNYYNIENFFKSKTSEQLGYNPNDWP